MSDGCHLGEGTSSSKAEVENCLLPLGSQGLEAMNKGEGTGAEEEPQAG